MKSVRIESLEDLIVQVSVANIWIENALPHRGIQVVEEFNLMVTTPDTRALKKWIKQYNLVESRYRVSFNYFQNIMIRKTKAKYTCIINISRTLKEN